MIAADNHDLIDVQISNTEVMTFFLIFKLQSLVFSSVISFLKSFF